MFSKEKKELTVRAIIEIMGRPAEFLVETLNKVVENLEKEDRIKVIRKEIFEPKEMEEDKGVFSTLIEMELGFKNMETLFEFIVNYLPSNVEIISPPEISFELSEANAIVHSFVSKVHRSDALAKKVGFENMLLKKQFESIPAQIKVEENIEPDSKKDEVKKEKKKKK